jgi:zinc protease
VNRMLRIAALASVVIAATAAAPAVDRAPNTSSSVSFPAASISTMPNGVIVATQTSPDTPLVGVQVFLPAGLAQQPSDKVGVAAVTASMVLHSPVEGSADLSSVADKIGGLIAYTVDQLDTRFSIECKAADLPRLLSDLSSAIKSPAATQFPQARDAAIAAASKANQDPALTAYAMVRQVAFEGTTYARPDSGAPTTLAKLTANDALAFASQYRHGTGTVVALSGNVTPDVLAAASAAFSGFTSGPVPRPPSPTPPSHTREVVAHRNVDTPWVAVGYSAPSVYGSDFPAMLVIETLLGRGGDIHTFAFGSSAPSPQDFVGGYYQFEAQPGLLVEFFNGANVDRDLHNLEDGVGRLRGGLLPADLLDHARSAALGDFLTSVTTLDDESWLLGRSALAPTGAGFENSLPARIAAVSAADVQRVARKYLSAQTIAVVLPSRSGAGQ